MIPSHAPTRRCQVYCEENVLLSKLSFFWSADCETCTAEIYDCDKLIELSDGCPSTATDASVNIII